MHSPLHRRPAPAMRWRRRHGVRRVVGFCAAVLLAAPVAVATQQISTAAAAPPRTLAAQATGSIHGKPVAPKPRPADLSQGAGAVKHKPVAWPKGASAVATIPAAGSVSTKDRPAARAGATPVWVGAGATAPAAASARSASAEVAQVRVEIFDRSTVPAAWRDALVMRLSRADGVAAAGSASVTVDYSDFAGAFGADWSRRLRLLALPACALTTPGAAQCRATAVASRNDTTAGTVSAEVALPAGGSSIAAGAKSAAGGSVLLALAAGPESDSGDYTATSMQASATWAAGGNAGDFSWNYPLRVPPSLGGPAPQLALAYSSSSMDGRSEATNNQPSWVGEGFEWWPGYIERSYTGCADDKGTGANNSADTGDECWVTDNANLSMSGRGGVLVKDGATGTWRLKNDDGSKIEHLTGASNGDNDGEYWKVTTGDGVQYFFGSNRLPGYTGTAPANKVTNSAWTVPVAGNHSGEPCHASSFASSFCTQAWRWNLDYVVDPHGNTMSLYYTTETNKYARNNTDSDAVSYVRGGTLDHIDYGTDNRSGTDTANTSTAAPMRVQLGTADRCLSSCTTHDQVHWADVPWDQECTGSSCADKYSPTFWTTKRLASVTTKVWNPATSNYRDVDVWTLTHNYPDPGDGTRAGLWLESIVHSGVADGATVTGGQITLPEINFDWIQLPNRVDTTTDGKPSMNWMRIGTIWTESGAKLDVRYTGADCVPGSRMPTSPQSNTLRCYPVLEEQPDKSLKTEYFHKYLVTSVTQADRTGGSPDVVTSYEYVGTPAWRHTDDDGITKDKLRTWSEFRGYSQVNTRVGDPGSGVETLSESFYFRGMHGDLNGSGGTRTVTLPALDLNGDGDTSDTADAPAVNDENAYSGMVRKTLVFDGVESAPVSSSASQPWQSAPTATRNMGDTTTYARYTGVTAAWSGTKLSSGGWRMSRSDTSLDSYGMPVQVDDQGDLGVSGDEKCIKTAYNRNTAANLLTLTSEVDVYALRCSSNPARDTDVISMTRTFYDHQGFTVAPVKGEPTQVDAARAWAPAGPAWMTKSTSSYDAYGRATDTTDERGNHNATAYTPTSGGPVTSVVKTNHLGWSTTETVDGAWGTAVAKIDADGRRTDLGFDALGRMTQVWLPNHTKASFPTQPNTKFAYLLRNSGGPNAVTTSKLNASSAYVTVYSLLDGLLRPRQTQSMSMANGNIGTVFSETKYDALGRQILQSAYFDATVQPSNTLFAVLDWQPKQQTATEYDRAGRVTASVTKSAGTELWRTTNAYGGDRVNAVPPAGGTAETTISDAAGRTIELRQYHNPADVGSDNRSTYDVTTYSYDPRGQQDHVTDNAGNTWAYTFDLLGRQVGMHDPDKGDSSATYNDAGDQLTATDDRGQVLAFTYDSLGRKTGEYAGSTSGRKLATWAYDPTGAKGKLASSSRWIGGTDEYKIRMRGYTPLGQSAGEDYIIPAVASMTGLSGTYTITRGYKVDGSPSTLTYPNVGGLGAETLTYTYDPVTGLPEQLQTNSPGLGQYVANTDYTAFGELSFVQYQLASGSWLQRGLTYDDATRRLTDATTIRQTAPQGVDNLHYSYDAAGNYMGITETPAAGAADNQCFGYDYARRLADAWTPANGDCSNAPVVSTLGGPAPYWQSWTYDAVGNRKTQTTHASAGDTVATYTYPAAGTARPHAVQSVATSGPGVNRTDSYGYDNTGNTTSRPGVAAGQVLAWDEEGRVAKNTESGKDTTYIYAADGTRIVMANSNATTLYLPGHEIKRAASGAVTATRYYEWAGKTCAMTATGAGVTWLVPDAQGTQQLTVAAGSQAITQRRQTPFGGTRGSNPAWPNTKGFVGGDNDATGLVNLGARQYDAALGRFISVDPVFDQGDPQSWTSYGYANNSPVTASDPTGLYLLCEDDNGRTTQCPRSSGGSSGKANQATSSPACSGGYCQGPPKNPTHFGPDDDDFKYDPKARAGFSDWMSRAKWKAKLNGCEVLGRAGQDRCDAMDDALATYRHYWYGDGKDMDLDFEKAYNEDPSIRTDIDAEIARAQAAAEGIFAQTGQGSFEMTGDAHGSEHYPQTENWQKAIGAYSIWGDADISVSGNKITMRITVHAEDRYNFNRDMKDIATGAPDAENGRFAELGWAKGFNTHGTVTREVTWIIGQPSGASVVNPASR